MIFGRFELRRVPSPRLLRHHLPPDGVPIYHSVRPGGASHARPDQEQRLSCGRVDQHLRISLNGRLVPDAGMPPAPVVGARPAWEKEKFALPALGRRYGDQLGTATGTPIGYRVRLLPGALFQLFTLS
jgi:hypothetical protein